MARTSSSQLRQDALAALARTLSALDIDSTLVPEHAGGGLALKLDDASLALDVTAVALVTPAGAGQLIAHPRPASSVPVVVADRITRPARQVLTDGGWGWLDRRGHLLLRAPGLYLNTDVPAQPRFDPVRRRSISGVAAITWASALLMSPEDPPSMRAVARRAGLAHSSVVAAAKQLRADHLVSEREGTPLLPELFWELAGVWATEWTPLLRAPTPDDAAWDSLGINLTGEGPGWAVADTFAAIEWGAGIAAPGTYPPDFYVPSRASVTTATTVLAHAAPGNDVGCVIAVAPTPLVCSERVHRQGRGRWGSWPMVQGVFAALDLAQDRSRGVEALQNWNPKEFTRVW